MNKRIQKKHRDRELDKPQNLREIPALPPAAPFVAISEDQHDQEFETDPRDGVWDATGDDTPWISPEDASAHGANAEEQIVVDLAEVKPYGDIVEPEDVPSASLLDQAAQALDSDLSSLGRLS